MATEIKRNQIDTNIINGWIPANESWAYASATTITVPSGAASRYAKGDKIKLTQTTVKYFYVIGVADTVLTVTGGSDYTVANAAISANYYSHQSSPVGFPHWFNTASLTFNTANFDDGSGGQPTTVVSKFKIDGSRCEHYLLATGTKATTNPYITFTQASTMPAIASNAWIALGAGLAVQADKPAVMTQNTSVYFLFSSNINDNTSLSSGVGATYSYLF